MTAGVYAITNTVDGQVYVGSSACIEARWMAHQRTFIGDAYEWVVLEATDPTPDAMEIAEQRWMDHYADRLCNTRRKARRPRKNERYLDLDGVRLQERREALGLSVFDLSCAFRCTTTSLLRWENGSTPLKGLTAIGADTVLKRLEREQQPKRRRASAPQSEGEE